MVGLGEALVGLGAVANADTPITEADVAKVARLARLDIDQSHVQHFTEQLVKVLAHFKDIDALDLSAVASGSGGFVINGQSAGEQSGFSVASAGDVNGDGLADLIVGAYRSDPAAGSNADRKSTRLNSSH